MQGDDRPPPDPKWPRLLSLSVHEFRTPMTVVAGYIRMLLKDRAGAVTDQQRRLLEEAEKSCAPAVGASSSEMSDLSNLEARTAPFNRSDLDLHALLGDADRGRCRGCRIARLRVDLRAGRRRPPVNGDPVRLKTALTSLITALRRELVTSTELFVRERPANYDGQSGHVDRDRRRGSRSTGSTRQTPRRCATFDEWRGGCGLSLAVARRVINAHGGAIWSPADGTKAGAVLALPRA